MKAMQRMDREGLISAKKGHAQHAPGQIDAGHPISDPDPASWNALVGAESVPPGKASRTRFRLDASGSALWLAV